MIQTKMTLYFYCSIRTRRLLASTRKTEVDDYRLTGEGKTFRPVSGFRNAVRLTICSAFKVIPISSSTCQNQLISIVSKMKKTCPAMSQSQFQVSIHLLICNASGHVSKLD